MAARAWHRPLFQVTFPGDDVSVTVRRSLAALDLSSHALQKLKLAADKLHLRYMSPIYFKDCYAHFGVPSRKLAIFMRQSRDIGQFTRIRSAWEGSKEAKGWTLLFTTTTQIARTPMDLMTENLSNQIEGLKR